MAEVFKPDGTLNFACGLCGMTDDLHTMECPIPDNQKAAGLVPDKRVGDPVQRTGCLHPGARRHCTGCGVDVCLHCGDHVYQGGRGVFTTDEGRAMHGMAPLGHGKWTIFPDNQKTTGGGR